MLVTTPAAGTGRQTLRQGSHLRRLGRSAPAAEGEDVDGRCISTSSVADVEPLQSTDAEEWEAMEHAEQEWDAMAAEGHSPKRGGRSRCRLRRTLRSAQYIQPTRQRERPRPRAIVERQ